MMMRPSGAIISLNTKRRETEVRRSYFPNTGHELCASQRHLLLATLSSAFRGETATGLWGRTAFILMAASQRPQNAYPPCSQPTTHQQQHSQVHFDKKDKFTPWAATEGIWGCCSFIVVFLSLLGSHYHSYGSWLYPWTISNPEERGLSVFLREGNKA